MDSDEKRIKQEDCNEDELGVGILTLTNKRIAFDEKKSRIADFSAKFGETVLDISSVSYTHLTLPTIYSV